MAHFLLKKHHGSKYTVWVALTFTWLGFNQTSKSVINFKVLLISKQSDRRTAVQ